MELLYLAVVDVNYQRLPLIQKGLEIQIKVSITMGDGEDNKLAIKRCKLWVKLQYKEPVNGRFEDATTEILEILHRSDLDDSLTDESST